MRKKKKINIHIWRRKEIENYAIHSDAIARLINTSFGDEIVKPEDVANKVEIILEGYYNKICDNYAESIQAKCRKYGAKKANEEARKIVECNWNI